MKKLCKLTVTAQDNSVTQYIYKGDTTKLTNDTLEIEPPSPGQTNGNNRLDYVDGLGRLRGVTENVLSWMSGSYGQSSQAKHDTTYNYDVLDDLTSVTQGTETRTFTCMRPSSAWSSPSTPRAAPSFSYL